MTTSNDDLQAKRERIAQLREQIAAEQSKAVERQQEEASKVEAAQLDAEEQRLERELNLLRGTQAAAPLVTPPAQTPQPSTPATQSSSSGDASKTKTTNEGAGA